jgi:hypothetical protein
MQCSWHDGKQRTSYVSFLRACCWWVVGSRRTRKAETRVQAKKTAKTRWVANDNSRKPSDYGVTCWFEGGNRVLTSGPEFKKGKCEIQICTSTNN